MQRAEMHRGARGYEEKQAGMASISSSLLKHVHMWLLVAMTLAKGQYLTCGAFISRSSHRKDWDQRNLLLIFATKQFGMHISEDSVLLGVQALGKHLRLHRCASFVANNRAKLLLALLFPAGTPRAEDPAVSEASEAAEAVPAESKRRNGKQLLP